MLHQPDTMKDPDTLVGVVLNGAHGIYDVHTDQGIIRCTLRGKLKKAFAASRSTKSNPYGTKIKTKREIDGSYSVHQRQQKNTSPQNGDEAAAPIRLSIGDYVKIRPIDAQTGAIEEILPRRSALSRKDVGSTTNKQIEHTLLANLDQVVLVFATTHPDPHFGLLDRYLMICESAELQVLICLNKLDLPHESDVEDAAELYRKIGYRVMFTSTQTGVGIDDLRTALQEHTSLFTGPSGVGKSSLVNEIEPGMAIRTGLVSDQTGKGKHTTTGSQLYPLSNGGWLADSAGIRALAAWNIPPEEMAQGFIEFRPFLGECEYSDCLHVDEEGCAIQQAVEEEKIDERRYNSYVRIVTEEER